MASLNRILQNTSGRAVKCFSLQTLCIQNLQSCKNCSKKKLNPALQVASRQPYPSLGGHSRFFGSDSDSAYVSKVLSHSTILAQDGIDIEELPILIKRATRDSFPFTSHTYTGDRIQEESEFDVSFRQLLQSCNSVNDVFKFLEVPSDVVRGYSASFALQRLHVLKSSNSDWQQIHSFIRSAVMRELYDTVQRDVHLLSNSTLLSLVDCYIAAEGFSVSCLEAINVEIQCRLADGSFSIEELLTLANMLKASGKLPHASPYFSPNNGLQPASIVSENSSRLLSNGERFWGDEEDKSSKAKVEYFDTFSAKSSSEVREEIKAKCQELLKAVWIHLASRYSDIDAHTLPMMLRSLTSDRKNMVTLLEKPMSQVWTDLSSEGVAQCLENLSSLRVYSASLMTHLGRWAYVNLHLMTPSLMLSFLNTFIQFSFLDQNLIKVMERCFQLKGHKVQTNVIAMGMEYCRSCRYLSPIVMDAAANHFVLHAESYTPLQLYAVLRVYGQLNYLPLQCTAFLKEVEDCLWNRFDHLEEAHLLEILGSFTFVDVLPRNFYQRISSQNFFSKVGALKNPQKTCALMWLKVLKHAVNLGSSGDTDRNLDWVLSRKSRWSVFCFLDSHKVAISTLKSALDDIIGDSCHHVLPFYGCCAIYLDEKGVPLPLSKEHTGKVETAKKSSLKIALFLRSAEHFTVNTRQLLGAQAQRKRQLETLGFIPVEIRAGEVFYEDVLREYLSPYLDLQAADAARISRGETGCEELSELNRDWLSYAGVMEDPDEVEFSSDDEESKDSLKGYSMPPKFDWRGEDTVKRFDGKTQEKFIFDKPRRDDDFSDFDDDDF